MKTKTLLLTAAIAAFTLMQMGCTPEETTTVTPGGTPLTSVPEVDPVIPSLLVGTEWVNRFVYQNTILGVHYDLCEDHILVFETESTGTRQIHGYPTSTIPEEYDYPDPLPFTYTYNPETGICNLYNIPGNNSFTYVYDNVQDALVDTDNSRVYFRVK